MERYGCLVIGVILALIILAVTVYYWSGWLNRPVGHSPPPALLLTLGEGNVFCPQRLDLDFGGMGKAAGCRADGSPASISDATSRTVSRSLI